MTRRRPVIAAIARCFRRYARCLDDLDRTAYETIAATRTPALDPALARLSDAADHSKLWLATAAVLAATGGRQGRQAATVGLASVGAASFITNVLAKQLLPRQRPDRTAAAVADDRKVRMPASRSFPSGHSASAFAFAAAVGGTLPPLSRPLHLAATAVAYSRIHTGVHYPGDTVAGALLGTAIAHLVRRTAVRHRT